jgi:DNA-binding MarR family transcriptional regulator/GNAT superfamily N-acetyltransferase
MEGGMAEEMPAQPESAQPAPETAPETATATAAGAPVEAVAAMRAFNRFYTNVIGLVHGMYLHMPYSLTEARLLFEMAQQDVTVAADLRQLLDIDAGYLSRVLSRFEADGLIARGRANGDARRQEIRLTDGGRAAAAELDARSAGQIATILDGVDRERLLGAMREISSLLSRESGPDGRARTVVIRAPRPGDLGWVVYRHGAVYAAEFGWNGDFERWVAKIIADYTATQSGSQGGSQGGDSRDRDRSAAWIAEVDGALAGSVLCVPDSPGDENTASDENTARLRVLLVERWARGLGIGGLLVDEVLRFARQAGFRRITLSTYDTLVSARRIYQAAGFILRHEEPEHAFGQDLNAQEWARDL